MKKFLLFAHSRDASGGVHDFISSHESYDAARVAHYAYYLEHRWADEAHVGVIRDDGELELFALWQECHRHDGFDGWRRAEL